MLFCICFIVLLLCCSQYLFGTRIGDVGALSNRQVYDRAVRGAAEVQQLFTVLPVAPCPGPPGAGAGVDSMGNSNTGPLFLPSMRLLDHGHFVNYGGTTVK